LKYRYVADGLNYLLREKRVRGFATGDIVQANVPSGKKAGRYRGRVAVRASGFFNIQTPQGVIEGIGHQHCRLIQRNDGYAYDFARYSQNPKFGLRESAALPLRPEGGSFSRGI